MLKYLSAVCGIFVSPFDQNFADKSFFIFPTSVVQRFDLIFGESESLNGDVLHRHRRNLWCESGKFGVCQWLHLQCGTLSDFHQLSFNDRRTLIVTKIKVIEITRLRVPTFSG